MIGRDWLRWCSDGGLACLKKRVWENPGHGVEEQHAHNERWAGALCLMGRFIISHYQLIPSDRARPAGAHQKYVKKREGDQGRMGASQVKRKRS